MVSINNRVVAYDPSGARQRHLRGAIRTLEALAVAGNGFVVARPDEVLAPLLELDGQIIDTACPESLLSQDIPERLGYD